MYNLHSCVVLHHLASRVDEGQVSQFMDSQVEPVLKLWPLPTSKYMNNSQLYSIVLAMKNKFQLIQGPPGTCYIIYFTIIFLHIKY